MRPTTSDIAHEAGVSLATVDRVLNDRPGVRAVTVEKVRAAIIRLGYVRDLSAANLARQRTYRLAIVIPESNNEFHQVVRQTLDDCLPTALSERTDIELLPVPAHDPHALVNTLNGLDRANIDGVGLMAPETPLVRDAIRDLKHAGIAVAALVSDLPNTERDFFVGINNVAAGRTAGELLGRFLNSDPSRVLVLASSMQSYDSAERRLGFDSVIAQEFPHITVMPTMESHDEPENIEAMVKRAFTRYTDIRGVYSLSTGNRALSRCISNLHIDDKPYMIAHELTPHTRSALQDGSIDAVITQDLGHIMRSALRILRAKSDAMDIVPSQERIRIEIIMRANLI